MVSADCCFVSRRSPAPLSPSAAPHARVLLPRRCASSALACVASGLALEWIAWTTPVGSRQRNATAGNIPRHQRTQKVKTTPTWYRDLALASNSKLIVFPNGLPLFFARRRRQLPLDLADHARRNGGDSDRGPRTPFERRLFQQRDLVGNSPARLSKSHLVPFGEYAAAGGAGMDRRRMHTLQDFFRVVSSMRRRSRARVSASR